MATDDAVISPHFKQLRGLSTTPPALDTSANPSKATPPPCAPSFMQASRLMRQEAQALRTNIGLHERATVTKERVKQPKAVKAKPFAVSEEFVLDSDDDNAATEIAPSTLATIGVQARSTYPAGGTLSQAQQISAGLVATRRRSWTPVEDTALISDEDDDRPLADRLGHKFTALVNSFAYPEAPKVLESDRPVKRRKTSADKPKAVKKSKAPEEPKEKKAKAPKAPSAPRVKKTPKKAQTITALATAAYRPQVETADPQITIPEVLAKVQIAPVVATKQKRKPAAPVKKAKKTARVKTPVKDVMPRVLLGPTQAQATLSNQVFIFGTSSQLHVEDSPETIQQIQAALQQSELIPSSNNVSPVSKSKCTVPTAPHGTSLSAGQADRDLWCVSARDEIGGILGGEAETQDSFTTAREAQDMGGDTIAKTTTTQQDDFVLISSDPPQPEADLTRPAAYPSSARSRSPSPSSIPPWPSAQRSALQSLDANRSMLTPQLGRSPAAARFKSALSPALTPSPRQGRPRKEAEVVTLRSSPAKRLQNASPSQRFETLHSSPPGSWHDVDQIVDPELPPSPSPRRQINMAPDQALEFDQPVLSGPEAPVVKDIEGQWPAVYAKLFPQITSTIRATPHSNSLTNPSWHEKILLYDPIVIEDLTLWLNAQGLRVKVLKGKGRKKKAVLEPDVEEVEQELTHQMVQKWCEEHSICCLWREGLRGGVRTRY